MFHFLCSVVTFDCYIKYLFFLFFFFVSGKKGSTGAGGRRVAPELRGEGLLQPLLIGSISEHPVVQREWIELSLIFIVLGGSWKKAVPSPTAVLQVG